MPHFTQISHIRSNFACLTDNIESLSVRIYPGGSSPEMIGICSRTPSGLSSHRKYNGILLIQKVHLQEGFILCIRERWMLIQSIGKKIILIFDCQIVMLRKKNTLKKFKALNQFIILCFFRCCLHKIRIRMLTYAAKPPRNYI